MASVGLHFCVSSTSFERNDISWPQQPLTEKVSDTSKKTVFLMIEAIEVIEAAEVLRPGKSLLRTSESSWHLNSALFLCFKKKVFWG